MSSTSRPPPASSGKRSRSKATATLEEETGASKRMKIDLAGIMGETSTMNRSRIYNYGYRKKPAELFRKDLISAMKLPDSEQLNREDYLLITDTWKEEWEKGVQVPVNPDSLPEPSSVNRVVPSSPSPGNFKMPKKLIKHKSDNEASASRYELDLTDLCWLESLRDAEDTLPASDELFEEVINEIETQCARNMKAKQVGIEYDDHIICDICRSPDAEDGNEMVFCDSCNICVHQACYGIVHIPDGEWLCRPCKEFGSQKNLSCALCPNLGGAFKPSTSNQWAHVACALWVPEVSIGCVSSMEPITKIKQIPASRWSLVCSLCGVKKGAPIQCSVKTCKIAYHVTCAFNHKLRMRAIVENGSKGVKLKSYCKRHSEKEDFSDEGDHTVSNDPGSSQHEIEIATSSNSSDDNDANKNFWMYIDINEINQQCLPKFQERYPDTSTQTFQLYTDLLLQYWKLKRIANYGAPLIKMMSSAAVEEMQMQQRNEILRLRVDLERIRNLSYMICRREKIKRNWVVIHQSVVEKGIEFATGISFPTKEELEKELGGGDAPESQGVQGLPELRSIPVSEEKAKLAKLMIESSVIYDDSQLEKSRPNWVVKELNRLMKADRCRRHKPNPYAKFYLSQTKTGRRSESDLLSPNEALVSPVNGTSTGNKSLLGLSSQSMPLRNKSVPLNGLRNCVSPRKSSSSENMLEKEAQKSNRSPVKSNTDSQSILSLSPDEKGVSSKAVNTRSSSLVGYKIPKKKHNESKASDEMNASVEEFNDNLRTLRREIEPDVTSLCAVSPRPVQRVSQASLQHILRKPLLEDHLRVKNVEGDPKGGQKPSKKALMKLKCGNSQSSVITRAQQNHCPYDEAALLASAAHDVDMRRQDLGLRHNLFH